MRDRTYDEDYHTQDIEPLRILGTRFSYALRDHTCVCCSQAIPRGSRYNRMAYIDGGGKFHAVHYHYICPMERDDA